MFLVRGDGKWHVPSRQAEPACGRWLMPGNHIAGHRDYRTNRHRAEFFGCIQVTKSQFRKRNHTGVSRIEMCQPVDWWNCLDLSSRLNTGRHAAKMYRELLVAPFQWHIRFSRPLKRPPSEGFMKVSRKSHACYTTTMTSLPS